MRVFEGFNNSNGEVCPVCKTANNVQTILIPIPGTEEGNIQEAKQVHAKCYLLASEMGASDEDILS